MKNFRVLERQPCDSSHAGIGPSMTAPFVHAPRPAAALLQPPVPAGIRTACLPLPIAPGSVNVYSITAPGGDILIDCGMCTPGVEPALREAGIAPAHIGRILLTHAHPDHSGFATALRERSGAPVWMHPAEDAMFASLADPDRWLDRQERELAAAGVPAPMLARIGSASLLMRRLFPALRADGFLNDGDVIDTALGPMRVIVTPGHAEGHVCFHLPRQRILISGDQLLGSGRPFLEWKPGNRSFSAYLESLRRLAALDVEWVLPAHGRPFRGLRERVESLTLGALAAAAEVRCLFEGGLATPHEVALARWNRPMNPFEHRSAVYEVMALCPSAFRG